MATSKLADSIYRLLGSKPMTYRLFGAWWWSVKWALAQSGYPMGYNDDPVLRERMSKRAGNDPERILRAGLREYRSNFGGYHDGNITVDGEPYYLHDDIDVTLHALNPEIDA